MTFQKKLLLKTTKNGDMFDITPKVAEVVRQSKIQVGMVNVFNVGTTASIGTIEMEPSLKADFTDTVNRLIPKDDSYDYSETTEIGNAHSHIQATALGCEVTIPISDGKMMLGNWQQIFHLECDEKPRIRDIVVTVYGDS
ncbi:secondary thiamine-phosphate synthase enzyme YjbQ [Pirellulaceae bacterium]|jgi:secondary thiamine-phosphate synthase enzyme|nr:secondary thiamine-phosphate synthase enzyme YjbQ [Pirellulaceae bacterium]